MINSSGHNIGGPSSVHCGLIFYSIFLKRDGTSAESFMSEKYKGLQCGGWVRGEDMRKGTQGVASHKVMDSGPLEWFYLRSRASVSLP